MITFQQKEKFYIRKYLGHHSKTGFSAGHKPPPSQAQAQAQASTKVECSKNPRKSSVFSHINKSGEMGKKWKIFLSVSGQIPIHIHISRKQDKDHS